MKKYFYFLALSANLLWLSSCDTEKNIAPRFDKTFIKLYGGDYKNQAVDLIALDDGGFAILGSIISTSINQEQDILFLVTDSVGNVKIRKQIGDPTIGEQPVKMVHDTDGYVICGNLLNQPVDRVFIYRISNSADSVEYKTYNNFIFNDMTETSDNTKLVFTGVYQDTVMAELTIARSDLTDTSFVSNWWISYGVKVDKNHTTEFPDTYKILGSINGDIVIKLWDLDKKDSYISVRDTANENSIPVDFLRGNYNGDNYIIVGYNNDPSDPLADGPFVSEIKVENQVGKVIANHFITSPTADYSNVIPSSLFKYESSNYLLLGTEKGPDISGKIRLLKLDQNFNVLADKSFGTGAGDQGVIMNILPDYSVIFLATVNYVPDKPGTYSKIALFKLTPDLSLDY